jgi:peptide chain release factor 3
MDRTSLARGLGGNRTAFAGPARSLMLRMSESPSESAARRRTFAIISHPDAGKTTLTEKFLLYGGAVQEAGQVKARGERRRARSDWMELEQKRGISITSAALQFPYGGDVLNLLDTPGHRDFSEDTYRVLAAVDAAVMVLDAAKGIEAQTLKLFEVCRTRNVPLLTFLNKWDRPGRDALELLDEIEATLDLQPVPVTWPVGIAGDFRGLIDRRSGRYVRYGRTAHGAAEAIEEVVDPEQAASGHEGDAWRSAGDEVALLEEVGGGFDPDLFLAGEQTPVFVGSALTNFGVRPLLDGIVELAPPPTPRFDVDGAARKLDDPFSAFVFKVQANMDPAHRDRVAFVRVCSGRFERGMVVTHEPTGRPFATKYAHSLFGQERDTVDEAFPGDIVALVNATDVRVGDTLYVDAPVEFPRLPEFAPEHFVTARTRDTGRFKQFRRGIAQLDEEGVVQVLRDREQGDQAPVLAAVGPMQLEVAAWRLEHEFGAATDLSPTAYTLARRTDEASEATLRALPGVRVLLRADGTLYALFESPYWLARVESENPELMLERLVAEGTAG